MAKRALPRSLFKLLIDDRKRSGRGHDKRDADQLLLETFQQLRADQERLFGKRFSVREFLRLLLIDERVSGGRGLSRAEAERQIDNPSESEQTRFEQRRRTLSNRLSRAWRKRRDHQRALSRALRQK